MRRLGCLPFCRLSLLENEIVAATSGIPCKRKNEQLLKLEREPGAELDFTAWRHGHGNGSESRRVHKTVQRAQRLLASCDREFEAPREDIKQW